MRSEICSGCPCRCSLYQTSDGAWTLIGGAVMHGFSGPTVSPPTTWLLHKPKAKLWRFMGGLDWCDAVIARMHRKAIDKALEEVEPDSGCQRYFEHLMGDMNT